MTTEGAEPLGESLDRARMTPLHRRFWLLAALGIMLDGFDFFIIGVANPLIAKDWGLSDAMKGLVSAAAIVGRDLRRRTARADRRPASGRRRIFKFDLVHVRRLLGALHLRLERLGADRVPLPARHRHRAGLSRSQRATSPRCCPLAPAAAGSSGPSASRPWESCSGALVGVHRASRRSPTSTHGGSCSASASCPALVIIWLRRTSARRARAGWRRTATRMRRQRSRSGWSGTPSRSARRDRHRGSTRPRGAEGPDPAGSSFKRDMIRRTIFTAVPWYLMDIAIYGVGIFTPDDPRRARLRRHSTRRSWPTTSPRQGKAALDVFLVFGFISAIFLVEPLGRIPLQLAGFAMMGAASACSPSDRGLAGGGDANLGFVIVGFALFNYLHERRAQRDDATPFRRRSSRLTPAAGTASPRDGQDRRRDRRVPLPHPPGRHRHQRAAMQDRGLCLVALVVTYGLRIEPKGRSLDDVSGRQAPVRLDPEPHPVPP